MNNISLGATEFNEVLMELQRVSKKYAMIVVPNDENLESLLVCCPECFCWFNNEFQLRSFNFSCLKKLLLGRRLTQFMEIGSSEKIANQICQAILRQKEKKIEIRAVFAKVSAAK